MTVAVLGFQIMIVLSLAFARAFGEGKLALACVGWTIFTFIMVVMSPLMLLQLLVIWGAFALLSPNSERSKPSGVTTVDPSQVEAVPPPAIQGASVQAVPIVKDPTPKQELLTRLQAPNSGWTELVARVPAPKPEWLVGVDAVDWTAVDKVTSVQSRVTERAITSLYHFTRVENLLSIRRRGLMPALIMQRRAISFHGNDKHRLDGHEDSISLSISHPNELLFYKWRMENPKQRWAVLTLDAQLLSTYDVAFYPRNAADHRMASLDRASLGDLASFDALFHEDGTRIGQHLLPFDPTNIQAEVLVFGVIEPSHITGAVFSDRGSREQWGNDLGACPLHVHPEGTGVFGLRYLLRSGGSA